MTGTATKAPPRRPRGWTPPGVVTPRRGMPPKAPATTGPVDAPPGGPHPVASWTAQPQPRRVPTAGATVASAALWVLAGLCVWSMLQLFVLGGIAQASAQADLRNQFRLDLAAQTAPLGGLVEPGRPVALIQVPDLDLEQVVVEGTAPGDTESGPGHLRSTVLPGQRGSSVVLGRGATYGAPFAGIAGLDPGSEITVTTGQGRFRYVVERVRRAGDPLPVPLPKGGARLTLGTSEGVGLQEGITPSGVVYVDALLKGKAVGPEPGRPARVPDAEMPLGIDTGALPELLLSTQGLLLAAAAVGVARRWVPGRVAWVLGAPLVLVFVWLTSELAVQLLPNVS